MVEEWNCMAFTVLFLWGIAFLPCFFFLFFFVVLPIFLLDELIAHPVEKVEVE